MNKDISIKVCMGTGGIAAGGVEVIVLLRKGLCRRADPGRGGEELLGA